MIHDLSTILVSDNRLLPKCNDRNKKPKRPFSLGKLTNFTENWPVSALFEVKNVEISQIPLGSIRLKNIL